MILNRIDGASRHDRTAYALVAFVSLFLAVNAGTEAVFGQEADGAGGQPVPELAMSAPAQAVVEDARLQLRSALSSDEGHVRFEALRGARNLREEWIAEIIVPYCSSPNLTERVLALEALVESDPEQGEDLFISMLEDPQRSIRLRALLGIERLGDPDAAFEVVKVMEQDPDLDLRVVAARALGSLGNPEASPALRRKITSHHPVLRQQSVLSLLKLGNEDVGEYLIKELEDDRDLDAFDSLRLLALVPDPSLIGRISHYLESEDQLVRTHAAITILSILERSRTGAP